ncbi:MAG: MarR family winged helix-turn-helix transcriptional regulator [Bacilli bacterium]
MNQIEELRYLIKASDKEGEATYKKLLAHLDITPSQHEILKILNKTSKLSILEVGELLICGSDNPSRMIQRLITKELIVKEVAHYDSRKVNLSLTTLGLDVLSKANYIEHDFNLLISNNIKDLIDVEVLIKVLRKQISNSKSLEKINNRVNLDSNK